MQAEFNFDGDLYEKEFDQVRLTGQLLRVFELMQDEQWRTLDEIARETGDPHASISARLRDFRKKRFGEHAVEKRSRGNREHGLFEYQLIINTNN